MSPQPKDIILKKCVISKSKNKKKNNGFNNGFGSTKSSEKNVFQKHPLKGSISQNAIKKKFIGLNSAKSIFINKNNIPNYVTNLNNSTNNANNENISSIVNNNSICMTDRDRTFTNTKNSNPPFNNISYIYQKKLK